MVGYAATPAACSAAATFHDCSGASTSSEPPCSSSAGALRSPTNAAGDLSRNVAFAGPTMRESPIPVILRLPPAALTAAAGGAVTRASRRYEALSMYFGGVGAVLWTPSQGFVTAADPRRIGGEAIGGRR